jgi:hypothetical protein
MRIGPTPRWMSTLLATALLTVAVLPLVPPVLPASPSGPGEFSVDAARAHIGRMTTEPRPIGSAANRTVRAVLVDQLEQLGLDPEIQSLTVPDYFAGGRGTVEVVNVMTRIPGSDPTGAVAVVGHYDTSTDTPGANDNTSALAVMLESARAILAGEPLRNDVMLLFTDGEEPAPRYGSKGFIDDHPWASEIDVIVNLEALGGAGPSMLTATGGPEDWLVDAYAASPHPVAFSYLTSVERLIPGPKTDFTVFRERGTYGLELAYLHDSPLYHTPQDVPDRVSSRSLFQHGVSTLALMRRLGDSDLTGLPEPSQAVYFTIGPNVVIRHSQAISFAAIVFGGLLLAVAAFRRRGGGLSIRSVARGVAVTVAGLVAAVVFGSLAWMGFAAAWPAPGLVHSYIGLAGMLAVVGSAVVWVRRRFEGTKWAGLGVGIVLTWWACGLALATTVPGMSYLFVWPSLVAAAYLAVGQDARAVAAQRLAWSIAVAGVALVVMVPAIDTFFVFAQPRPGNTGSQLLPLAGVSAGLAWLVAVLVGVVRAGGAGETIAEDLPVAERQVSRSGV